MANSKSVAVEIEFMGQKIPFRTEGDPALVREIVELAKERIDLAQKRAPNQAPHKIAMLALLDIAEEYIKAKGRVSSYQKDIQAKSFELFSLTDARA
jgi:hypothetical protein